jgi:hypothetical protein
MMAAGPRGSGSGERRRRPAAALSPDVVSMDRLRIERALAGRARYRYVQPTVVPAGTGEGPSGGWKIVSPNCSRTVDPAGGDIDIAWFEPVGHGRWALHARDHRLSQWHLQAAALPLAEAVQRVCSDPLGRFWP